MRGKAPLSAATTGPTVAPSSTEATARLLWEACRRDPDPAGCGVPSPVAPTRTWPSPRQPTTGSDRCCGGRSAPPAARDELGPERAVLGGMADALNMEALLLLPHAVALAVRPLTEAGLEPVVFKGPAVAARYPEAGAAADGGHRPPAPARRPRARARRAARRGVAGGPPRRRRPLRHRARPRRRAVAGPRAPLRTRRRLPARHRARSRGALGQAPAARGRGDAGLRTPAGRRARRAVGSRRQAAPRIRPPGLDRRPGHDRGRRRPSAVRRSTGSACRARADAVRCATVVGAALALARRAGVEHAGGTLPAARHGAGAATPCAGSPRSRGRSPISSCRGTS